MTKSIQLKFLFANKDGVVLERTTEMDTPILELKLALIASWPTGDLPPPPLPRAPHFYSVTLMIALKKVKSPDQLRLVCMGQGILSDHKTLEGLHDSNPAQ